MSIWGKVSGAAAGFIFGGGPIGALAGAFAGHVLFDRGARDDEEPGVVFTIAIIALSAKMAKADGTVTPDEIEAFGRMFRVPPSEEANVRRIFNFARQDTAGYEIYAGQIARIFRGRPSVLEDVLDGLFEIAMADGLLHPAELEFLERVADIFGFRAGHVPPDSCLAYGVRSGRSLCCARRFIQRERRRNQTHLSHAGAREPSRQSDGARRARGISPACQ